MKPSNNERNITESKTEKMITLALSNKIACLLAVSITSQKQYYVSPHVLVTVNKGNTAYNFLEIESPKIPYIKKIKQKTVGEKKTFLIKLI